MLDAYRRARSKRHDAADVTASSLPAMSLRGSIRDWRRSYLALQCSSIESPGSSMEQVPAESAASGSHQQRSERSAPCPTASRKR